MIPPNILFLHDKDRNFVSLKMQREIATSAINIVSIKPYGNNRVQVTFGATIASLVPGAKVTLASTTGGLHDGIFKIIQVDNVSTPQTMVIESMNKATQAGAAGTATPDGTVRIDWFDNASAYIYKNNDGIPILYKYATTGKFILQHGTERGNSTIIQIVNLDGADQIAGVTVKWSLDGIHWLDFATALTSGAIIAGNSYGFVIDMNAKSMYLLITVTDTAGADYTILGG